LILFLFGLPRFGGEEEDIFKEEEDEEEDKEERRERERQQQPRERKTALMRVGAMMRFARFCSLSRVSLSSLSLEYFFLSSLSRENNLKTRQREREKRGGREREREQQKEE